MQLPDHIIINAIPAFLVLIVLEMLLVMKEGRASRYKKSLWANLTLGMGATTINIFLKGGVFLIYSLIYEYRLFTLPSSAWWVWVIVFLGDDISYYWFHRLSHQIRFLWASHAVHHSSDDFSFSTALRVPWTGNISGVFLFWAWMPLVGIDPGIVIMMKAASVIYQFWLHTEHIKKLPRWFEAIFNTPSLHRVHHASNVEYLDKNHGGTLIIWDKIFKTYQPEIFEPTYGLTKPLHSGNPLLIAFHEWKNMWNDCKNAKDNNSRLNYLIKAPGWNENNMRSTPPLAKSFL